MFFRLSAAIQDCVEAAIQLSFIDWLIGWKLNMDGLGERPSLWLLSHFDRLIYIRAQWIMSFWWRADFSALNHLKSSVSVGDQAQAVRELIQRNVGHRALDFDVSVSAEIGTSGKDSFTVSILHITIDTQAMNSNSHLKQLPFVFSLLVTDRIHLRTKRYRKCQLVPVYGSFYTVWYVSSEKDMATKTHYYDAFREWW